MWKETREGLERNSHLRVGCELVSRGGWRDRSGRDVKSKWRIRGGEWKAGSGAKMYRHEGWIEKHAKEGGVGSVKGGTNC